MKPFLKWAGGKRWLVSAHPELLSNSGCRHIEPFLGGGAVFFDTEPDRALLSDSNRLLVETYEAIRDEPDRVRAVLRQHQSRHSESYYYEVRNLRPRTPATRAARLIYLNRTCFNGLYRVNLRGEFNVPKGSKDSVLFEDDDFSGWSTALENAEMIAGDFQHVVDSAGSGDFVYADPPYTVKHNNNNFLKYNEEIFSWADQVRLARSLEAAVDRGAQVVVSNANHHSVRALYPATKWEHTIVSRYSVLASFAEHRRATTEIVIASRKADIG